MYSHHRLPWLAAIVIVAATAGLSVMGCNEEGLDTRNIVEVVSFNDNQPLNSDVWVWVDPKDPTKGGGIPKEVIEVTFASRPHDDVLTIRPGEPFGSVRFTSFEVVFSDPVDATRTKPDGVDLDGDGTADLMNFKAPWNSVVPIGQTAVAYIEIIGFEDKAMPPVGCLIPYWLPSNLECPEMPTAVEYSVNASVTFRGTEETSGDSVVLNRGIYITIAEFADQL